MNQAPTTGRQSFKLFWIAAAIAILIGTVSATTLAWTCDDAFISFQYARNLLRGLGMVFNPGERVEGATNFLWTLWIAVGMRGGITPEAWANFWGIVFYVSTIGLLVGLAFKRSSQTSKVSGVLPIAALGAAAHYDFAVFATSGLETACFTFLAVAGYAVMVWERILTPRALALAAFLFALCSLARPDGALFAFCGGLYVCWQGKSRFRDVSIYALSFAAIWVPFMLWRFWYYGDIFPNTYYAKSAYLSWYSQGLLYLSIYLKRYWILLAIPAVAFYFGSRATRHQGGTEKLTNWLPPHIVFALLCCGLYTFYIVRVGGDFMFARFLIPATPFALIFVEHSLNKLREARGSDFATAMTGAFLCFLAAGPLLMRDVPLRYHFIEERAFYNPEKVADSEREASELAYYFKGLPVRVAFMGTRARLVYRLDLPLAVESATGLTDKFVARQIVKKRGGWPGHEKPAPGKYLLERRVNFVLGDPAKSGLPQMVPPRSLLFRTTALFIVHRSPPLISELKRRGAVEVNRWYDEVGLENLSRAARESHFRPPS